MSDTQWIGVAVGALGLFLFWFAWFARRVTCPKCGEFPMTVQTSAQLLALCEEKRPGTFPADAKATGYRCARCGWLRFSVRWERANEDVEVRTEGK